MSVVCATDLSDTLTNGVLQGFLRKTDHFADYTRHYVQNTDVVILSDSTVGTRDMKYFFSYYKINMSLLYMINI